MDIFELICQLINIIAIKIRDYVCFSLHWRYPWFRSGKPHGAPTICAKSVPGLPCMVKLATLSWFLASTSSANTHTQTHQQSTSTPILRFHVGLWFDEFSFPSSSSLGVERTPATELVSRKRIPYSGDLGAVNPRNLEVLDLGSWENGNYGIPQVVQAAVPMKELEAQNSPLVLPRGWGQRFFFGQLRIWCCPSVFWEPQTPSQMPIFR